MYTEDGIPYMKATGKRKTATAEVTVYGQGTGKFRVNGNDILYFEFPQDREQVYVSFFFRKFLVRIYGGQADLTPTVVQT